MRRLLPVILHSVILPLVLLPEPSVAAAPVSAHVAAFTDTTVFPAPRLNGVALRHRSRVARLYAARACRPLWTHRSDAPVAIPDLIACFADAGSHGLDARTYPVARLRELASAWRRYPAAGPSLEAALDVLLTDTVMDHARRLSGWRLPRPLEDAKGRWPAPPQDLVAAVARIGSEPAPPAATLETLAPTSDEYAQLRAALAMLGEIDATGGWPRVPDGPVLRPGESQPRVRALRARLLSLTGPPDDPAHAEVYGIVLAAAVRAAQRRYGLTADGVVGPRTLAALNVTARERCRQVALSLERLRWLPRDMGSVYVRVDALRGELRLVAGDSVVARMRVITGRPDRPTPVVSSRITVLEVNPAWNIPQKLARRDVLPHILQDSAYLADMNIRVFASWRPGAAELDPDTVEWSAIPAWNLAYKLQQQPGPANPLGRVKFMFANPHSVFIHDTPHVGKFSMPERFYSSGCVRIEDPLTLARALLGRRAERLDEALESGATVSLTPPRPVPVHLVYLTAWVDGEGRLHFRDDVYGFDGELSAELAAQDAPPTQLPGSERAGVDVDESGSGVMADPADSLP